VIRTQQKIILDDASANNMFSEDDYFRQRCPRSILCLPLIKQTKLIGILYLENKLTAGVFTPKRLAMVEIFASQAAISLDHARLYSELSRANAKLEREVNERLRAEAAVRRSEAYLSEAQRLSRTGSFGWEISSGKQYWSEETFRIFGFDPTTEPTLELVLRRTHPEDRALIRDAMDRISREGKTDSSLEYRLLMPDGSVKHLRAWGRPSINESGSLELVGAVTDITEQKRAEEELRRSQAYLAEAESLSKSGTWALNPSTKEITYWSQERYHLFGFDPEEGIPSFEAVLERIHPEDRTRWLENTKRAESRDSGVDFRVVLPGGEIKHLHGVGHPVFNESGELVETLGAVVDITELKRAEKDLHEKEVSLREAQSSLAHVSRLTMMGELVASIAHEVNQPLGAIANNTRAGLRFLASGSENLPDVKEALSDILKGADRVNSIIVRMRALAKKTPPEITELNFTDVVTDVLTLIHHELTRRQVETELELWRELPPVLADRIQVQQVLLNLVMNGVEAMNDVAGDRKIWIRAQPYENNGSSAVLVSVQDSGSGLKQADVDRLFETFFTTKPLGLGMGLAISRSIVEAHGGRLWLASAAGPGATFQFVLPAKG
jgi:PAS domain S-box-containing protein